MARNELFKFTSVNESDPCGYVTCFVVYTIFEIASKFHLELADLVCFRF